MEVNDYRVELYEVVLITKLRVIQDLHRQNSRDQIHCPGTVLSKKK